MNIPSTHDSLLAALGQEPAESAWAAFHDRYREVILAWCRRRGLEAEAEDVTQEILLKLLRVLPQHVHDPGHGLFRSWLKTVVQNALRDYWRKNQRHPEPPGIGGSTFLGNSAIWRMSTVISKSSVPPSGSGLKMPPRKS